MSVVGTAGLGAFREGTRLLGWNTWRAGRAAAAVLLALLAASCGSPALLAGFQQSALTAEEQAVVEEAKRYQEWPKEEDLPVPPDGWYTLELGGDTIEVFRDEYGTPHVFAPSLNAVFRGQGYVIMEDRCLQILKTRETVMGRQAMSQGPKAVGSDKSVRTRGYTEPEREAIVAGLRPDLRGYMEDYVAGVNEYLRRHAPQTPPLTCLELAAGAAFYMARLGDGGADEHSIYKLLTLVQFLKGRDFMLTMLHDVLPLDVPNSPTTDHSHLHTRKRVAETAPEQYRHFDPGALAALYGEEFAAHEFQRANGVFTKWGSQTWTVRPERSATGHPMLFAGPMMHFDVPAQAAQVHLVAPGFNVAGICFIGIPGVIIGHNDRVAWGCTSGFMLNQSDIFVEELNPARENQYWHNGQWRDMETFESPIPVKNEDGSYGVVPLTVCRTVHGPVLERMPYNHQAYSVASAHDRLQLQSFAAFLDINRAQSVYDVERAVRNIATSHNFTAADVDGNIGYWLSGRIPKRSPGQDPRLPTPGTGEYEWQGITVATDLASTINPPEGWLGNFNGKPSVNTPGWWPEFLWGHPIHAILEAHNPIDWETFVGINRANGEHHMAAPFFQEYLVRLLRTRGAGDPRLEAAARILEQWPGKDLPGATAALLLNEWAMESMVEFFRPDFGFLVQRSMSHNNLQLFGLLLFRILQPEKSGVRIQGDYLHGRDKEALALECFQRVLDQLTELHGPDMAHWPYMPPKLGMGELGSFPSRNCGTYWIAIELTQPIRSMDMLFPGQSELHASPHFRDQFGLFWRWQYKDTRFSLQDFDRVPGWLTAALP